MPFSHLIGNDLAKVALGRMLETKTAPGTLLFYGPEGVGKSLFALALAEQLLQGKALNHPDLHHYYPEGKTRLHTIETMRGLIQEMALPPYVSPVKVFIIHDAHQMQAPSANALLKTLEEPAPDTYFILLTSDLDALLPTILSRSRRVAFFPIAESLIETFVQEKWEKTGAEAHRIAFFSCGSLQKAYQLAQGGGAWRSDLIELLTLRIPQDYAQFQAVALRLEESCTSDEESEEAAATHADALFEGIAAWYRDLHLLKEGIATEYLYHLDQIDALKAALAGPIPPLEKVLEQIAHMRLGAQRHIKLRTVLEHGLLNC